MALSLIRASVSSSSDSYLGQGGIITALWFFNQSHGTNLEQLLLYAYLVQAVIRLLLQSGCFRLIQKKMVLQTVLLFMAF